MLEFSLIPVTLLPSAKLASSSSAARSLAVLAVLAELAALAVGRASVDIDQLQSDLSSGHEIFLLQLV